MPTRREILKSALALPAAPGLLGRAYAQDAAKKDEIFADFESGTFDGWTLTGNCWAKEPHQASTIQGITGFQGKRFLCTLHPKLGNAATGKAVSREFIIDKPFINFRIGGGRHPGEACLNLVVDGKVVRTESGPGSSTCSSGFWAVPELIGRLAHLVVVDSTASDERGYVMVDDIKFRPAPTNAKTSPLLVLLARFSDVPQVPAPVQAYRKVFGFDYPGFGHYLSYCTGGRLSILGTQVLGWIDLPFSRDHYRSFPNASEQRMQVLRDAQTSARSQIDLSPFKHLVLIPNSNPWGNSGEAGQIDLPYGNGTRRYTWACINDENLQFQQRTIVHEVGHALGLFHTWAIGDAPGADPSWWSGMCGQPEYYSRSNVRHEFIGEIPLAYNGLDRTLLGGIAANQILTLESNEDRTLALDNLNDAADGGIVLIHVPKLDGPGYYTVEVRLFDMYYDREGVLKSEGVVIHDVLPGRNQMPTRPGNGADGAESLVIPPPGAGKGRGGKVAWRTGQVFTADDVNIRLEIGDRVSRGYQVHVSRRPMQ